MATTMHDLEKQDQLPHTTAPVDNDPAATSVRADRDGDPGNTRVDAIRESNSILRFLVNIEKRIDGLTKFEAMGVERVPEDKRQSPQILNVNNPLFPQICTNRE